MVSLMHDWEFSLALQRNAAFGPVQHSCDTLRDRGDPRPGSSIARAAFDAATADAGAIAGQPK